MKKKLDKYSETLFHLINFRCEQYRDSKSMIGIDYDSFMIVSCIGAHYLKNNTEDEQKIIELLEDISRDLMNYDLEFRIQELESKFSVDMSETTFNELKELKKKQNLN